MSTSTGALRRSTGRFVLYVHWSVYSMLLTEVVVAFSLLLAAADSGWPLVTLLSLVVVHTATNFGWLRWSLRTLRRPEPLPPRLRPWLVLWLLLTVAIVMLAPVVMGWPRSAWPMVVLVVTTFAVSAFAPRLPWWLVPAVPVLVTAGMLAVIVPHSGDSLVPIASGMVIACLGFAFVAASVWLTGWMLGVVYALDDARGQSAQLAIAEERLRISRDLHDVFGRTLATVAVKSELASELARRGRGERAADEMAQVRAIADDAGKEVRRIVAGVRGSDLSQELVGARSLLESAGVESVVVDQLPEGRLEAGTGVVLGAVVREAVTNVIRHSRARSARIMLRLLSEEDPPAVELTVVNDGVRPGPPSSEGHGLVGMAERLDAVGGTLEHRRDGGTFVLTARVPFGAGGGLAGAPTSTAGGARAVDPVATGPAAEPRS
ncbi:two-component sensor histidine kinase [Desertihabitans brevis]|uniref:Two-component sensor histidine kinase n=1 Tax=Desertihabitans brevis TaxID=2268447 RepID=A0A367YWW8_9ACTN|nr:histidine kinase [Desertihabitans brevis]RCK70393.1 two-component sensor histidine kinase [Desertihabitans brevis]